MKLFQMSAKRLLDIILSFLTLVVLSPVLVITALGIKMQSPGPILYKAKRMGQKMKPFYIYKFRTMHVGADKAGSITAANDSRVFAFGNILRKLKVDELPQLVNILRGDMTIIGPRPEDIDIVNTYYSEWMKDTLSIRPGLASPGSVFNYTHGEEYLNEEDTEKAYVENLMPIKLAMDYYYKNNFSLLYDIEIIYRTICVIVAQLCGKKKFVLPKEYNLALEILADKEEQVKGGIK